MTIALEIASPSPDRLLRAILWCALVSGSRALPAQVLRGRVLAGDAPLADALVIVDDSAGSRVAESLVDESGRFVIGVRKAGRYVLRARRIGFTAIQTPPFSVRAGETVVRNIVMTALPFSLNNIVISGASQCVVRPAEGEATARVWDEVRKNLEATRLAYTRRMLFVIRHDVRMRRVNGDVVHEQNERQSGASGNPFFSAPPDSLARAGYVVLGRDTTDSSIFYAPDANVLLSESFGATHCLRTRTGDARHPQDVGLAFEPVESRGARADGTLRADVRGVLWVDGRTSELRALEFSYTGMPFGVSESQAGGRLEFLRLSGGALVVREWMIRAPEMREIRQAGADTVSSDMRVKVFGLRETSGEIVEASTLDGRALWHAAGANLVGVVVDSEGRAPVAGAIVRIGNTAYRTATDADGRWRLDGLPTGPHELLLSARVIEVFGAKAVTRLVTLRAGVTDTVSLVVPATSAFVASACGDAVRASGASVVAGIARDSSSGASLAGATVLVWSMPPAHATSGTSRGIEFRAEFVTDSVGAFHVCGVPDDAALALRVRLGDRRSGLSSFETSRASIVIRDALVGRRVAILSP